MRLKVCAVAVVVVCLLVSLASVVIGNRQQCSAYDGMRSAIVQILQRGVKDLPKNVYYKMHPAELAGALAQYQIDINQINGGRC